MNTHRKRAGGTNSLLLLNVSVMLFGLSAVLGRFIDAPAVVIAGGRVVCSSVTLLLFSLATKSSLRLDSKKDLGLAVATGAVPVSYTHLDVYKRQTPCCSWTKGAAICTRCNII